MDAQQFTLFTGSLRIIGHVSFYSLGLRMQEGLNLEVGDIDGERHCPNCGKDKSTRWLEKQSPRLLPVHHFLLTFTVPDQVGSLLRRRQRAGGR